MLLSKAVSSITKELRDVVRKRNARHVIDPRTSRYLPLWEAITTIALCYTALVTPYEVSFIPNTNVIDVHFWANTVLTVVFAADLVLQFFLMYPVNATPQRPAGWIDDRRQIALHYLHTW